MKGTITDLIRFRQSAIREMEKLKELVYSAAIMGRYTEIEKLREAMQSLNDDIAKFDSQILDFKLVGE